MDATEAKEKLDKLHERRKILAESLHRMNREYQAKKQPEDLKIVGPLLEAFSTTAASKTLEEGASPLLMSLKLGMVAINTASSKAGIIGPSLEGIIDNLATFVQQTQLVKVEEGKKDLFKSIVQLVLISSVCIATKLGTIQLVTDKEAFYDDDEDHIQIFEFVLMILMIINTGVCEEFFKVFVRITGVKVEQEESMIQLLNTFFLFVIICTNARGSKKRMQMLCFDLKETLLKGFHGIQTLLNLSENDAVEEKIALQQALSSLENEDFETLYESYKILLENMESKPEIVYNELYEITSFFDLISNSFKQEKGLSGDNTTLQMI